jgi:hypothetical protein
LFFIVPAFTFIALITKYYDTLHEATKHESPLAGLKTVLADLQISGIFKVTIFNHLNHKNRPYSLEDACIPYDIREGETGCERTVGQTVISFLYVIVTNAGMTK